MVHYVTGLEGVQMKWMRSMVHWLVVGSACSIPVLSELRNGNHQLEGRKF